ncbi:hypothetical protein [Mesorhizobium sp. M2A.F.Ca.ET.039.01.1.1]|uniref:hypothetical protein n=1 Tax=Mesorhizobium sp. M2A.F.Ca.ET.039.01.1.1 TaxID=2496746 RepID=UPI000FCCCE60|nr:hypothetical protein [Mesorhizobium sp. M2A.F.Ca.ET.039.01.1.1]RWX72518.1 hypothetical protein EOA24_00565 [Mesorhizobium sp. M2A.F.Ca.ET.039.01.1.1]
MHSALPWWAWLLIGLTVGSWIGWALCAVVTRPARAIAEEAQAVERRVREFMDDPTHWGRS